MANTTIKTAPITVTISDKRSRRRWIAGIAIIITVGIIAPSPLALLPAHDPVCQSTFLC